MLVDERLHQMIPPSQSHCPLSCHCPISFGPWQFVLSQVALMSFHLTALHRQRAWVSRSPSFWNWCLGRPWRGTPGPGSSSTPSTPPATDLHFMWSCSCLCSLPSTSPTTNLHFMWSCSCLCSFMRGNIWWRTRIITHDANGVISWVKWLHKYRNSYIETTESILSQSSKHGLWMTKTSSICLLSQGLRQVFCIPLATLAWIAARNSVENLSSVSLTSTAITQYVRHWHGLQGQKRTSVNLAWCVMAKLFKGNLEWFFCLFSHPRNPPIEIGTASCVQRNIC